MNKNLVWFGAIVGGVVGGGVPSLWGASMFSAWSVVLSTVGGLLGIYGVYWFSKR